MVRAVGTQRWARWYPCDSATARSEVGVKRTETIPVCQGEKRVSERVEGIYLESENDEQKPR